MLHLIATKVYFENKVHYSYSLIFSHFICRLHPASRKLSLVPRHKSHQITRKHRQFGIGKAINPCNRNHFQSPINILKKNIIQKRTKTAQKHFRKGLLHFRTGLLPFRKGLLPFRKHPKPQQTRTKQ